jgi:hypothetical protein
MSSIFVWLFDTIVLAEGGRTCLLYFHEQIVVYNKGKFGMILWSIILWVSQNSLVPKKPKRIRLYTGFNNEKKKLELSNLTQRGRLKITEFIIIVRNTSRLRCAHRNHSCLFYNWWSRA